ncbi:MAG: hypothetical protein AAGI45_05495 [Cyanobacteria bacterium P01_H01_bin.26]
MKMAFSAAVCAALGSGFLYGIPVSAATFTADFSVDIVNGDFLVGDTFFGQLTYKDDDLSGVGTELVDLSSGLLSLSFDYVAADLSTPATYTEVDDDADSGFPLVVFEDGELTGLNYAAAITPELTFQFRAEPIGKFGFFTDDFATFATNTGTLTFAEPTPVNEPSIVVALLAITGLGLRRRR